MLHPVPTLGSAFQDTMPRRLLYTGSAFEAALSVLESFGTVHEMEVGRGSPVHAAALGTVPLMALGPRARCEGCGVAGRSALKDLAPHDQMRPVSR